jgi:methionyl-tRNA formyltransferase
MDHELTTTRARIPLRLILMGTGPFAVPSFEALRQAGPEIVQVITRPLPPVKSRSGPPPSPVRVWAESHGLAIADPPSINADLSIDLLRSLNPSLLVVCDYGQILKPAALETARLGGINLHGSLLPKYRGAAPVQWAMIRGESVTGVSVIHMTPRLDGGPVLVSRSTPIRDDETAGELEQRLSILGVEATLQAIDQLASWDGNSPLGVHQDPLQITQAPRLKKSDGEIQWDRTAREIDCQVRGMQPWPIAFTHLSLAPEKPPIRLSILGVRICSDLAEGVGLTEGFAATEGYLPGEVVSHDVAAVDGKSGEENLRGLVVAAGDRLIAITRLQPAGKREMTSEEFLRGHQPGGGARMTWDHARQ